jgi:hypothetical protein
MCSGRVEKTRQSPTKWVLLQVGFRSTTLFKNLRLQCEAVRAKEDGLNFLVTVYDVDQKPVMQRYGKDSSRLLYVPLCC